MVEDPAAESATKTQNTDKWPPGKFVNATWPASSGIQHRPAYQYKAWVPPFIAAATPILTGKALLSLVNAESQYKMLQPKISAITDAFVRIEALSSSRIEGLKLSYKSLAMALAGVSRSSSTAKAVAKNVYAINKAIELASEAPFSVAMIQNIHKILCEGTQLDSIAGEIRVSQNWIGKGQHGPSPKDYAPPPPGNVERLLEDLCNFANRTDLPVVFQMAVTHAQFELIHPFGDGNGRVGRCLMHAVQVRRLGADTPRAPFSSVLAASVDDYIASLERYREGDLNGCIEFFSQAMSTSVGHMNFLASAISNLQVKWLEQLGVTRKESLQRKAIALLPSAPVVDAKLMSSMLDVDMHQAIRTLNTLADFGILEQLTSGKRNRVWVASEIIRLLEEYDFSVRV